MEQPTSANQAVNPNVNENGVALLSHLSGIFFYLVGPLVMYLIFKDNNSQFLKQNIVNSLNWQISFLIYILISSLLLILFVGFIFIAILNILNLIFSILGAIEANKGNIYKYPLTIEFIK